MLFVSFVRISEFLPLIKRGGKNITLVVVDNKVTTANNRLVLFKKYHSLSARQLSSCFSRGGHKYTHQNFA